jgi:hypothetical protein
VDGETLLHSDHISRHRGSPDAWKAVLSSDEVSELETTFEDFLVSAGYRLSGTDRESD